MSLHRLRSLALATLCALAGPAVLLAAPEPWNAKVLWARADRAYVVLAESTAVEPGTVLTFEEGGATIAKGEVRVVHEGQLVAVTVTSGALERARSLPDVRITAEAPSVRAMPLLRVGFPAPGRPSLLVHCDRVAPAREGDVYRVDALSDHSFRFVKRPDISTATPWPDTILVRLFDVAADEEIALERGDLDVAVFWPGEPSPHIRTHTSWKSEPAGSLDDGILAVEPPPGTDLERISWTGRAARALRHMNDDLFRGDLAACGPGSPGFSDLASTGSEPRLRFEVSRSIPGWQPLERRLNQGNSSKAESGTLVIRLDRVRRPDAAVSDGRDPTTAPADSTRHACAFTIRCPILSAPRLRPYLAAIGPDALVRLFTCSPGGGSR